MNVLNFYTLYAKNKLYMQLKQALKIEENICRKKNNEDNFFKFHFNYEKI